MMCTYSKEIREFVSMPLFDEGTILNKDPSYPKISIVTPSYNQAEFLERAILSVLNQNYPNLEYIIIDGGSNDRSVDIIKKYEKYLSYWVSEKDKGQSNALNKGFALASGEIMGWLNADDIYLPQTFQEVENAFKKNPQAGIVFGDHYVIDKNDNILRKQLALNFSLKHLKYEGMLFNIQAAFWREEVHNRFGNFDESLHFTMDYDMMLRLGMNEGNESFFRVSIPLAAWRRHSQQKCSEKFNKKHVDEHRGVCRKYGFRYFGKSPIRLFYRMRRLYLYLRRKGIHYVLFLLKQKFYKNR